MAILSEERLTEYVDAYIGYPEEVGEPAPVQLQRIAFRIGYRLAEKHNQEEVK